MIPEPEIHSLLIGSCHSSQAAKDRLSSEVSSQDFVAVLVRIAVDAEDYGGDAPMQAAYYLSKVNPDLMRPYEDQLLGLFKTANGYAGHVALVLGRIKSKRAKPMIEAELAGGDFPSAWLFREALEQYDQSGV